MHLPNTAVHIIGSYPHFKENSNPKYLTKKLNFSRKELLNQILTIFESMVELNRVIVL